MIRFIILLSPLLSKNFFYLFSRSTQLKSIYVNRSINKIRILILYDSKKKKKKKKMNKK